MVGNTLLLTIDGLTVVLVFISSCKPVALTVECNFNEESPASPAPPAPPAPAPDPSPSPNSPPAPNPPAPPNPKSTFSPLAIISCLT